MTIARLARQILATTALAAGVTIGLAATASAQPDKETDFLECVVDHQDTDGIGVCCIFYGGELEGDACYIDFAQVNAPQTRPTKPTTPAHTLPRAPITAVGSALTR